MNQNEYDGFRLIEYKDHTYNFVDKDLKILTKDKFKKAKNFENEFAGVQFEDETWNFIDKEGKILSKENFLYVYDFENGFARVEFEDETWNFIDKNSNFLLKKNACDIIHLNDYSYPEENIEHFVYKVIYNDNEIVFVDEKYNIYRKEEK